ncbi:Uncharacterised protein [Vibrio cholerae]|nr:Uncharacterised protein [Vibrio cholerae]CSB19708.1 Uncharacterised protein [Vibrio cholerae]CSB25524.1 Uncharacterised protein [Vibrio cholerae]CSC98798.1 Uncharacterised protein [Vibrio cholerae]CSD14764.1 Uncharacterised protein [Vibrio cholerae]
MKVDPGIEPEEGACIHQFIVRGKDKELVLSLFAFHIKLGTLHSADGESFIHDWIAHVEFSGFFIREH